MGSFDRVKNLLNEVTYNLEKSIARDKKLAAAHDAKMASGMKAALGFEKNKKTEPRTSQLKKVKSQGGGKGSGATSAHKAKRGIGDHTEIVAVLKSLKDSYESGLITEEAFLKIAKPIMDSLKEGAFPVSDKAFKKMTKGKKKLKKNSAKIQTAKTNYSPKGYDKG